MNNQFILNNIISNMEMSGFDLSDEDKNIIQECLENKRSFDKEILEIINTYNKKES